MADLSDMRPELARARYVVQAHALPHDSLAPVWIGTLNLDPPDGYELHSWRAVASLYPVERGRFEDESRPTQGGRASIVVMWRRVEMR